MGMGVAPTAIGRWVRIASSRYSSHAASKLLYLSEQLNTVW